MTKSAITVPAEKGEIPIDTSLFLKGEYVLITGIDMQADPQWRPHIPGSGDRKPRTDRSVVD